MASDFGDESGEKMLDSNARIVERWGESAIRRRAWEIKGACEQASEQAETAAGATEVTDEDAAPAWARLDMSEFKDAGDWEETRPRIEEALRTHHVEPVWLDDAEAGRTELLFRIEDARQVSSAFDDLGERVSREAEHPKDDRPLDERARQARQASEALEAQRATTREREIGEVAREVGTR